MGHWRINSTVERTVFLTPSGSSTASPQPSCFTRLSPARQATYAFNLLVLTAGRGRSTKGLADHEGAPPGKDENRSLVLDPRAIRQEDIKEMWFGHARNVARPRRLQSLHSRLVTRI